MIERRTITCGLLLLGGLPLATGCVRRTIEITSTPTEALVWVNAREMGRTPVSFEFTYEGQYDIRLQHDGYQPLVTSASTDPPIWDLPGPDFVAEILPFEIDRTVQWHFDLLVAEHDPGAIHDRALVMQGMLSDWKQAPDGTVPDAAGTDVPIEDQGLIGPPVPFGRPSLPPDTAPGEAPVRPPELYPRSDGIQPGS
ncbi:MAG: PEGA domain-containing protein [Phycisphaerales bacterium]|nr:PEGA domain-containing protein [Phycisphaerales bacterium]